MKCVDVKKIGRYNKKVQLMDTNTWKELEGGILAVFNNQALRIVLYGSYARETYTSESDVDIAVLLNGNLNESTEDRLADLVVDLNLKYDKTFSVLILIWDFQKWEKIYGTVLKWEKLWILSKGSDFDINKINKRKLRIQRTDYWHAQGVEKI